MLYETGEFEIIISYAGLRGKQLDRRRLSQDQRDRFRQKGFRWDQNHKHWRKQTTTQIYNLDPWRCQ